MSRHDINEYLSVATERVGRKEVMGGEWTVMSEENTWKVAAARTGNATTVEGVWRVVRGEAG